MKSILAVVAGILTGTLVIYMIESATRMLYPLPPDLDLQDRAAMEILIKAMPVGALLMVLLAYAAGSFSGGMIAALIARNGKVKCSLITGLFFLVGGVFNFLAIPHPLWFAIISLVVYLPMAGLGGFAGERFSGAGNEK